MVVKLLKELETYADNPHGGGMAEVDCKKGTRQNVILWTYTNTYFNNKVRIEVYNDSNFNDLIGTLESDNLSNSPVMLKNAPKGSYVYLKCFVNDIEYNYSITDLSGTITSNRGIGISGVFSAPSGIARFY